MNKIFILNDHAVVMGGADAVALSQYNDFVKSGLDVTLCSVVDEGPRESADDLISYSLHPRNFFKNLFWVKAYKKVRKLFVINEVGVYIIHSWTKQLSSSIFYALRGRKVYIVAHDYFLVCPNGGLYNYNKKQKCNVRGGGAKCLSINCDKSSYWIKGYRWLRFWIQAFGIKICNPQIIALNELQVHLFRHFRRVRLLKNKIDQGGIFSEINLLNRKYLTYIGRGDPEKGISVLGDREFVTSLPIVIIGPDKGALGLSFENVIYTGWLNEVDMGKYLDQTLIGIFPSLWHEVDPLIPWKFFSRGIPVACSIENIFGQFLVDRIPELVYSNVKDLNNLLQKIENKIFYEKVCAKVKNLYTSEVDIRADIWSRGFGEIIN